MLPVFIRKIGIIRISIEQRAGCHHQQLSFQHQSGRTGDTPQFGCLIIYFHRQICFCFIKQVGNKSHHLIDRGTFQAHLFGCGRDRQILINNHNRTIHTQQQIVIISLQEFYLRQPSLPHGRCKITYIVQIGNISKESIAITKSFVQAVGCPITAIPIIHIRIVHILISQTDTPGCIIIPTLDGIKSSQLVTSHQSHVGTLAMILRDV